MGDSADRFGRTNLLNPGAQWAVPVFFLPLCCVRVPMRAQPGSRVSAAALVVKILVTIRTGSSEI